MKTELLERNQLREATNWMLRLVARINRMTPGDPVAEEALEWLVATWPASRKSVGGKWRELVQVTVAGEAYQEIAHRLEHPHQARGPSAGPTRKWTPTLGLA